MCHPFVIEAPERLAAAASLGTIALLFLFRDILALIYRAASAGWRQVKGRWSCTYCQEPARPTAGARCLPLPHGRRDDRARRALCVRLR